MEEKILVADDHSLVREGLRRLLSQAGFEVVEAENGEEAIKIAEELGPCLVLWDLLMPGGGLEGLRRLREKSPRRENSGSHRAGYARAKRRGSSRRRPGVCGENRGSRGDSGRDPRRPSRGNPRSARGKSNRPGRRDPPPPCARPASWGNRGETGDLLKDGGIPPGAPKRKTSLQIRPGA